MQERRTLIYVDKDDIPSSALLVTSESQTGNVIYFKLGASSHYIYGVNDDTHILGVNESSDQWKIIKMPVNSSATNHAKFYAQQGYIKISYSGSLLKYIILAPVAIAGALNSPSFYEAIEGAKIISLYSGKYVKVKFTAPVYFSGKTYGTPDGVS